MTDTEYISRVNSRMASYLDEQIKLAPSKESKLLISRIKQTTQYGKRFRPKLLFNVYSNYNGKENIVDIGVALELLHQTLLIHDDLIDEDYIRHNKPNLIGIYFNEYKDKSFAYNQALLAGDLLHNFVSNLVADNPDISKLINNAFINTIYGQQLDILNVDNNLDKININDLIKVYELKTASYSTNLPVMVAAKLANIDKKELERLKDFAIYLGIYFQLDNDHQDYFGSDQLKDYCVGKITYPYIAGLELTNGADRQFLKDNFGNKKVNSNKIVDILIQSKAKAASKVMVEKYLDKAYIYLDKLNIPDQEKLKLRTKIRV